MILPSTRLVREAGETSIDNKNPSRRSSMIEIVEKIAENMTVSTTVPGKKNLGALAPTPNPISAQKIKGEATTPSTRLFWRQKRTNSRFHSVSIANRDASTTSPSFRAGASRGHRRSLTQAAPDRRAAPLVVRAPEPIGRPYGLRQRCN